MARKSFVFKTDSIGSKIEGCDYSNVLKWFMATMNSLLIDTGMMSWEYLHVWYRTCAYFSYANKSCTCIRYSFSVIFKF